MFQSISPTTLVLSFLYISAADAQWHENHGDQWNDGNPGDGDAPAGSLFDGINFGDPSSWGGSILISHAVIASAVWVLLIPSAGILLRLNLRSPWVLRIHATLQIVSYLLFAAAAGLGIWLVNRMSLRVFGPGSMWDDPHPVLGLVILGLAFFQPILGTVHHRLFKKRVAAAKELKPGPAPGRTVPGHMHLWLGRILILLGMINGGLGIRLASYYPFQSARSTRIAAYTYGFIAGAMLLLYLIIVVRFERNKARRDREAANTNFAPTAMSQTPPTYTESQVSIQKTDTGASRYG